MNPALIKLEQLFGSSTLTKIEDPLFANQAIELWLKRDDLLHPVLSGNKWRKLKHNLDAALSLGVDTVISMGGAYSNHLHALAFAGKMLGLKTIGIVRGERPARLTPTLTDMEAWGMELRFVSRADYRSLRNHKGHTDLPVIKPNQYWLPEGGAGKLALKGVAELVAEIDIPFDVLCVACGTGATLAGLVGAVEKRQSVLGFAALKNAGFLQADIQAMLSGDICNSFQNDCHNWIINHDYHFGGFAKHNAELDTFIAQFEEQHFIPLEAVYTGKMLYGIYNLALKGYFKPGQRIVAVHTGGLQGKRGFD